MHNHRRYKVRSVRVAAGLFLTGAAVAAMSVLGSGPASAAAPRAVAPQAAGALESAAPGTLLLEAAGTTAGASAAGSVAVPPASAAVVPLLADAVRRRSAASSPADPAALPLAPAQHVPGTAARVAGIRQEMDQAVAWGEVTRSQADRFLAQLESRIARGL